MTSTITPTGTELQIATDSLFTNVVNNTTQTNYRTSQSFVKGDLPFGVNLYARVRHIAQQTGYSKWSPVVTFQVAVPSKIIGVCLDNSGTKGVFYWIDALGNKLDSFDWANHPCYSGITAVLEDTARSSVYLTKFPKSYIKTAASGPTGSFASGLKCWWISSEPEEGFRPALCFKRSTTQTDGVYNVADYAYMGRYLCHSESVGGKTCCGSKPGQTVLASTTKANFKTYITNRNNASAGVTGFRMFDIYDLGWLRTLALIAYADSDTLTRWGDNSAGTSYPKTGSTNARMCFKGSHSDPQVSMEDMWRCYWYYADLITVNSGVVTLTSPMDLTSSLSFGSAAQSRYKQPTTSGWIRDVLDCPFVVGNDTHDLMELFLPASVVSAENQGTFSDYHNEHWGGQSIAFSSGAWWQFDTRAGLFTGETGAASAETMNEVGSRLSKN